MKLFTMLCLTALIAACGEKVPEHAPSKELGNAPKQTIDKAVSDVARAAEQGAKRSTDEGK
jgi:hypothetical protein